MTDDLPWYDTVVLPGLLRHARATYGRAMRRALDEAGYGDIPANGLYVIGSLAGNRDAPLGQVIRELGITKQAAGQLVDTLVLRGYLERSVDESDRRRLTVTLTERGRAASDTQGKARDDIDAELLAGVGAADVAATRRTLGALCDIGQRRREAAEQDDAAA